MLISPPYLPCYACRLTSILKKFSKITRESCMLRSIKHKWTTPPQFRILNCLHDMHARSGSRSEATLGHSNFQPIELGYVLPLCIVPMPCHAMQDLRSNVQIHRAYIRQVGAIHVRTHTYSLCPLRAKNIPSRIQ